MQIRSVLFIVGVLLVCVGASLVLPLGVSLWYGDGAFLGLLSSLVIMVGGGLALAYTNRSQTPLNLTLRDGFAVVGICWIVASFAGGLPFVLTSTASVTDAVFEAASGFTTTGATIFADIEGLAARPAHVAQPDPLIGGLGIILALADRAAAARRRRDAAVPGGGDGAEPRQAHARGCRTPPSRFGGSTA